MTDELAPVRCVTCNKILGNKLGSYQKMIEEGTSIEQALNNLGLTRPCCRLRLRNPFKVVDRNTQLQSDISKTLENNFDTLSVSMGSDAPTTGALSALTSVTAMTIIPEEDEEIELPPIPTITKAPTTTPFRTYQSW